MIIAALVQKWWAEKNDSISFINVLNWQMISSHISQRPLSWTDLKSNSGKLSYCCPENRYDIVLSRNLHSCLEANPGQICGINKCDVETWNLRCSNTENRLKQETSCLSSGGNLKYLHIRVITIESLVFMPCYMCGGGLLHLLRFKMSSYAFVAKTERMNIFHLRAYKPSGTVTQHCSPDPPVFWTVGFGAPAWRPSVRESTPQGCSDDSHAGWFTHDPRALPARNTPSCDPSAPAAHFDLTTWWKTGDAH